MQHIPQPNEVYRHFKGNLYQIVTLAEQSETGEMLVIYQAMYGDYKIYARPIEMFMEKVDQAKYPEAVQDYRFELQNGRADIGEAKTIQEKANVQAAAKEEPVPEMDSLVLEFLDADTYSERLNILAALHHRITDDMINIMAIASDIEVEPGNVEARYEELKYCLMKFQKYECSRQ